MTQVLIIGAGPTGLACALALQKQGVEVRIIDEKEGPSTFSKALGIQCRTLEIFEKLGVAATFLEKGLEAKKIAFEWKNQLLEIGFEELDAPYPFILLLAQSETEKILAAKFEESGGKIEWGTKFVDLEASHEVILEKKNGKKEKVAYPWIIACDGAHSLMRRLLKLSFKGAQFPEYFLIADVEIPSPPFEGPHIFLSPKGFTPFLPFGKPTIYRAIFPLEKSIDPQSVDHAFLMSLLQARQVPQLDISKVLWVSSFQIHRRMTNKMRVKNIFLAGDASHIHSPVGGQGMNTGIQDAFNLAWKLALVIKGASPERLLDTYEQDRHGIAKAVLKNTSAATKLLTFTQKWCPSLFYFILRQATQSKSARQHILNGIAELSINYRGHASVVTETAGDKTWKGPRSGDRAPDGMLEDGKRLFDLLQSPAHVLLLFAPHPEFEEVIQKEYGKLVEVHVIDSEDLRKKYAAGPDTLYLIRPDGYIYYRSSSFQLEETVGVLHKIFKPFSQRNKL